MTKTYWLWVTGPWDLPNPRKSNWPVVVESQKGVANPRPIIGTETIISKNLFDPERGAGLTREAEVDSRAFQRIRSMVLLGTAIIGDNRVAIFQDGAVSSGTPGILGQAVMPIRIKVGDTIEGFRLSEISDTRIVFASGTATVEVPLDYYRKIDVAQPPRSVPQPSSARQAAAPRVATPGQGTTAGIRVPKAVPALPRRDREPAAGE